MNTVSGATRVVAVSLLGLAALTGSNARAAIIYGGFTFDDGAFADTVEAAEPGGTVFGQPLTNLLGFSPDTAVFNIGYNSSANLYDLGFTDFLAINDAGDDLVLFDARFSEDPYDVAVRLVGATSFSSFISYDTTNDMVDTGERFDDVADVWALPIDLSDYGLGAGVQVDAIRFRARDRVGRDSPEGDPVMAGVLNGVAPGSTSVPEPATVALLGIGLSGLGWTTRRRRRG